MPKRPRYTHDAHTTLLLLLHPGNRRPKRWGPTPRRAAARKSASTRTPLLLSPKPIKKSTSLINNLPSCCLHPVAPAIAGLRSAQYLHGNRPLRHSSIAASAAWGHGHLFRAEGFGPVCTLYSVFTLYTVLNRGIATGMSSN